MNYKDKYLLQILLRGYVKENALYLNDCIEDSKESSSSKLSERIEQTLKSMNHAEDLLKRIDKMSTDS